MPNIDFFLFIILPAFPLFSFIIYLIYDKIASYSKEIERKDAKIAELTNTTWELIAALTDARDSLTKFKKQIEGMK